MNLVTAQPVLKKRARTFFAELQDQICAALELVDGVGRFREDLWTPPSCHRSAASDGLLAQRKLDPALPVPHRGQS